MQEDEEGSPRSDDRRSPDNPNGKMSYGRNFLLQLQFSNKSKKPPNLPEDLSVCKVGQHVSQP